METVAIARIAVAANVSSAADLVGMSVQIAAMATMSDFDAFWTVYPLKRDRLAAQREYVHARRLVSAETILQGVERYRAHCEQERTPSRYIKKPTTWLMNGCWDDEYDEPMAPQVFRDWFRDCDHTPRCNSKTWCAVLRQREEAS